jgi:hypothetical protein
LLETLNDAVVRCFYAETSTPAIVQPLAESTGLASAVTSRRPEWMPAPMIANRRPGMPGERAYG